MTRNMQTTAFLTFENSCCGKQMVEGSEGFFTALTVLEALQGSCYCIAFVANHPSLWSVFHCTFAKEMKLT